MQRYEDGLCYHKHIFLLNNGNYLRLHALEDQFIGLLYTVVWAADVQNLRCEDRLQIKVYIHLRSILHNPHILRFHRPMEAIVLLPHFLHCCNEVSKLNFIEHLLHTNLQNIKLLNRMGFNVVLQQSIVPAYY